MNASGMLRAAPVARRIAMLGAAVLAAGCSGGDARNCGGGLLLNEYVRETVLNAEGARQRLRVELHNAGDCPVEPAGLAVAFGGSRTLVPGVRIEPGGYRLLEADIKGAPSDCADCDRLRLVQAGDGTVVDAISVPAALSSWQSAARMANADGLFALQDAADTTLGAPNRDPGPVAILSEAGGFRPRDSSSNAIVHFRDRYWVLGGWSNFGHDLWLSVSDVWRSSDGVNWQLVAADAPYSPYSAFVVFQDRIWAIGPASYSSADGVAWRPEPLQLPVGSRAVIFRGAIVAIVADRVLRSADGRSWTTLQDAAPWGPHRSEPGLLVHQDRLWLIGGTDEPGGVLQGYTNDVWSSAEGVDWVRATANAAWEPRRWFGVVSAGGLMWVANGANYERWADDCNNTADLWASSDGVRWQRARVGRLWAPRHASFVAPAGDGAFILAAGYGNCGVERIYGDVWRVEVRPSMFDAPAAMMSPAVGN